MSITSSPSLWEWRKVKSLFLFPQLKRKSNPAYGGLNYSHKELQICPILKKLDTWTPLPPTIRNLQALVRRIDSLISMKTQEMNRIDVSHESVRTSLNNHIAYLDKEIGNLRKQIATHIKDDPELKTKRDLLKSIPGIGEATIASILAELPVFERCDRVEKVVAFIGLAPRQFISGSSLKGKPRLSKVGNARLRKALFMPALVSIQCNPVIQAFYHRLKEKEKNGKVIVCAIMRKLVHLIFGILKSGRPFDPNYAPYCA